ncbi:MAG: transcription-repair coupling factor, partial [Gammaproteobacteria bacterium]|nr:transcription-repair coupling factor [Gammaproteobacteria bacterium]
MPTPLLETPAPATARELRIGQLYGSSRGLLVSEQIAEHSGLSVIVCCDMADAEQLEQEIRFFSREPPHIFRFPDLETLPYDQFSPHQDIVSERIQCLASITDATSGVLILPVSTLLQKVSPPGFIRQRSLDLKLGDRLDPGVLREKLGLYGYSAVSQVEQHGEFSTRGSILDLFPMGSREPYRIDFFDDEIESMRNFDPETQLSIEKTDAIKLLPAQEYPLDEPGIERFRLRFRETFDIDPNTCPVYVDISAGISSPGVEYYLPLFFDQLVSLFDYLPATSRLLLDDSAISHAS